MLWQLILRALLAPVKLVLLVAEKSRKLVGG